MVKQNVQIVLHMLLDMMHYDTSNTNGQTKYIHIDLSMTLGT